jgi:peptidyl-tRNA hydrolase
MPEFAQSIVIRRGATHEDTVRAAAIASVQAYLATSDHPSWRTWLAGPFIKTVRRAREGEFSRLAAEATVNLSFGTAAALAWIPTLTDALPAGVSKLQVSGTDFPRQGWPALSPGGPVFVINDDLPMTTGKTAAQLAHALFVAMLNMDEDACRKWEQGGCPISIMARAGDEFAQSAHHADVHICDAGRTEVAPGTMTVVGFTDWGRGVLLA